MILRSPFHLGIFYDSIQCILSHEDIFHMLEVHRKEQISLMLIQKKQESMHFIQLFLGTSALYRKYSYVLWKRTSVKKASF